MWSLMKWKWVSYYTLAEGKMSCCPVVCCNHLLTSYPSYHYVRPSTRIHSRGVTQCVLLLQMWWDVIWIQFRARTWLEDCQGLDRVVYMSQWLMCLFWFILLVEIIYLQKMKCCIFVRGLVRLSPWPFLLNESSNNKQSWARQLLMAWHGVILRK